MDSITFKAENGKQYIATKEHWFYDNSISVTLRLRYNSSAPCVEVPVFEFVRIMPFLEIDQAVTDLYDKAAILPIKIYKLK